MTDDFSFLQERYAHLCRQLTPHEPRYSYQRRIQTRRQDDGAPHVELIGGRYDYVVTERGRELERKTALSEDELLYWLMGDVVTGIALQIELEYRIPGQDSRRQWFSKSVELLARLSPEWKRLKELEYAQVLSEHPFRDEASQFIQGEPGSALLDSGVRPQDNMPASAKHNLGKWCMLLLGSVIMVSAIPEVYGYINGASISYAHTRVIPFDLVGSDAALVYSLQLLVGVILFVIGVRGLMVK